jgi:hypothetical protein
MLIDGDPIASAALEEFNRRDLLGSFAVWPSDHDIDRLQTALGGGKHYIAVNSALLNVAPDLDRPPRLGKGLYLFENEPDDAFKTAFITLYAGHVGLSQAAHDMAEAEHYPDETEQLAAIRDEMLDGVARSLSAESRRLVGGYALLVSEAEPREYIGFAFSALALVEHYQFATREAVLKGSLNDQTEEQRRRRLHMQSDPEVENLALNDMLRGLVSLDTAAEALGVEAPPIRDILSGN